MPVTKFPFLKIYFAKGGRSLISLRYFPKKLMQSCIEKERERKNANI